MMTDKQQAQDPSTPPERLAELSDDPKLMRDVAKNPNTPKEILLRLASKCADEFFENPVFSILWLEDPSFLQEVSQWEVHALAASHKAPTEVLRWLFNSYQGLQAANKPLIFANLAKNPNTPAEILSGLCFGGVDVRKNALKNPNTPAETKKLAERAGVKADLVNLSESYDPTLSAEELTMLYTKGDMGKSICARHPNTPKPILEEIAKLPHYSFLLIENPSLPQEQFDAYLNHKNVEVRAAAIRSPRCPIAILTRYASDTELWYRGAVARNAAAPANLLEALSSDKEAAVRKGLVENPATPIEVLRKLAKDTRAEVRRALAWSRTIPAELCAVLAKDKDEKVRSNLAKNSAVPKELREKRKKRR